MVYSEVFNLLESDMPCPKCGWMMHDNGKNYFVCENPRCGYMKHIDQPVKSKTDLLKEIEQLKADVAFYKKRWLESPNSD